MKKIGRNDPCPCGSGKKYKKCCGNNKVVSIDSLISQEIIQLQLRLLDYAMMHYGEDIDEILDEYMAIDIDENVEETLEFFLTNWAIFCQPIVNGKTIIEDFIQKHGSQINRPKIKAILESWIGSVPSLLHLLARENENTILVKDFLSNESMKIKVLEDGHKLEIGSILIGLPVPMENVFTFFTTFIELPADVSDFIMENMKVWYEASGENSSKEFMKNSFHEVMDGLFNISYEKVISVESFTWYHPLQKEAAKILVHMLNNDHYPEPIIQIGILLWYRYCQMRNPLIRNPFIYAAALHYLLEVTVVPTNATYRQKDIAQIYGVSIGSFSAKYREMYDVLEDDLNELYDIMEREMNISQQS
jgi:uncharacterized protein YecA (UPF0149 family)